MDTTAPPNQRLPARGVVQRLIEVVSSVRVSVIVALSGVATTTFAILGILQRTKYPRWDLANLDSELSIATYFSALLLWSGAAGWLLAALATQPKAHSVWIWWLILAWLALDEGAAIHERVERWSGVDWQILYLPILAIAAIAWRGVVRRYRDREHIGLLLVAGAIAWAATLLLELIGHWGGEPATPIVYNTAMVAEEALEMAGSTLFIIASVLTVRGAARRATTIDG